MMITWDRPPATSFAIAGDTGHTAAFVSPTDGSALFNGRVADKQRMSYRTGAGSSLSEYTLITIKLANAIAARSAALLMPSSSLAIPAGVKIDFSGGVGASPSTPVALGGNALGQRTQLLPIGSTAAWVVFPSATIDTLYVKIYNDRNGATWAAGGQLFDVGEIWVGRGADFNVENDVEVRWKGGLLQRRTHNNQPWALEVVPWRELTVQLVPMTEAVAIGPNSLQSDYETVACSLSTQTACALIPSYLNRGAFNGNSEVNGQPPAVINSTTINVQRLHRTAVFGVLGGESGQPISTKVNGDQFYTSPIVFGESPP
jgi:hypothetical protein